MRPCIKQKKIIIIKQNKKSDSMSNNFYFSSQFSLLLSLPYLPTYLTQHKHWVFMLIHNKKNNKWNETAYGCCCFVDSYFIVFDASAL